ncbi:MAG: ABC transporter ATP-binding protein [Deltaproteobacteria bacterium]|nr:ABC transporter ATP-binding protein [Deltaproteobacteria bacterium]
MTENNILLSVQDLKVHFQGDDRVSKAVEGASFKVRKGESVCLVGESGCGKSVSVLSVMGLIPSPPGQIVDGHIQFDGMDLLHLHEEAMQNIRGNRIAMVFQEPMTSLNPVFTISDQIQEAILAHEDLPAEKARKRSIELLSDVGIPSPEERLKDYPHQLSGGQRQRVMIAMALACNPDLVIADEPTTALDVTIQAQILNLFAGLKKKRQMSLLYITHDLGVVAHVADRVYVMYAGIIAEQGSASQIFKTPRHPYTRGLLASLPSSGKKGEKLHSIPGMVPDPAFRPTGCPFHPRCENSIESCKDQFPALSDIGEGHQSRCPVTAKEV